MQQRLKTIVYEKGQPYYVLEKKDKWYSSWRREYESSSMDAIKAHQIKQVIIENVVNHANV